MPVRIIRHRSVLLATLCALLALSSPASAQYFGRNKVQYKHLDYEVLKTEHFDIYFYPSERSGVDLAARLAERWHARLSRIFEHQLRGRQPLVLYASHPDFEQTNVIPDELGEGTGGVTEPLRRRIVLPLAGPLADTDHVIGHELVHAFQFDMTSNPDAPQGENRAERLPLWFIEGMAEYLSIGPFDPNTAMWLRDAARDEKKLPSIDQLDNPKYFPYRWGQAFWAYVGGRWGDEVIRQMFNAAATTGQVDEAIQKVLGLNAKTLSSDWHAAIHQAYDPVWAATTPPGNTGRIVIKGSELGADMNVGPAISPDGRWVAFLSERNFFSTDLYVADATTGQIVHRLTRTATNPHFSSIQFISSAGAWDGASTRIAIAAIASGRPAIAVFDVQSGRKEQEIAIPTLDEIFNPTWAPDGHALCFTGLSEGLTDLYVYDLQTARLRRLTRDPYADLQPAWSADGRRIAFATDRFSTELESLKTGAYRLALIDPDTGAIDPVPTFADGKNINPQWSPDSHALYFISDRNGIPNLYRVTLASLDIAQLTNVPTGVSGITSSSPAMSIASRRGVASFSVYEGGKYNIYTLDVSGQAGLPAGGVMNAGVLPPVDRRTGDVATLVADATLGLPEPTTYPVVDYKPKLSLEGAAQPTIAVGANRFGAAFGAGLSLYFSDMLANHALVTAVQLNSGLTGNFKDTGVQAGYFNQVRRWNWGVVGGQIPYLSGAFQTDIGRTSQGELVGIDQTIIYRQTERSASGIVAYPFDRARRVELTAGLTQITFDQVVQTTTYSLYTGRVISDRTSEMSLAPRLSLATSAAAFVHDTSNLGATSPVQGQRYRIEAAPTFGTISFTSALGDYRRYFMPVSFYTLATRLIHYGRYGAGGEDPRLYPLYIGYPTLVRGYDVNTFNASECVPDATSACPAFDRLLGSRMLVGNLEFRFPLLRPFGVSSHMYGPLPVELGVFADGGVAWNRGERPSLLGGSRGAVSSAGVTLRANIAGFAVGQFDIARPFQRPGQGWVFQFNLTPGF